MRWNADFHVKMLLKILEKADQSINTKTTSIMITDPPPQQLSKSICSWRPWDVFESSGKASRWPLIVLSNCCFQRSKVNFEVFIQFNKPNITFPQEKVYCSDCKSITLILHRTKKHSWNLYCLKYPHFTHSKTICACINTG